MLLSLFFLDNPSKTSSPHLKGGELLGPRQTVNSPFSDLKVISWAGRHGLVRYWVGRKRQHSTEFSSWVHKTAYSVGLRAH